MENGSWTNDDAAATCYDTTILALKSSARHHLSNVQIVLKFNTPSLNITIPVANSLPGSSPRA